MQFFKFYFVIINNIVNKLPFTLYKHINERHFQRSIHQSHPMIGPFS